MLPSMAEVVDTGEEDMEEDMLPKFVVIVERQNIPLIHPIKSMVFHLISSLKIRTMIRVILMQFFRIQILIIMSRIMKVRSQRGGVSTNWFYSLVVSNIVSSFTTGQIQ